MSEELYHLISWHKYGLGMVTTDTYENVKKKLSELRYESRKNKTKCQYEIRPYDPQLIYELEYGE